jgi:hypothetical protein
MLMDNMLGKNNYHKEKHKVLSEFTREGSLDVNTDKTKYMVVSCQQNAGQNHK